MRLKVIGTGSKGNAYLLEADGASLLLDAGLSWMKLLPELPDGLKGLAGCLVTHEHQDHAKSVEQILQHGIPIVMSTGTWKALHPRLKMPASQYERLVLQLSSGQHEYISPFTVMATRAEHDAKDPLAFLIRYEPTGETVLYATDTYKLPNRYPGINYWLVECNYTLEKIEEMSENPTLGFLYERLAKSHMSLERLCNSLQANDLSKTRSIVLVHISQDRGDPEKMVEAVHSVTGIQTMAAYNGLDIELGTCPF